MKIYVIDNGGQWTHREWRVLRDLKVDTKIVPNTTPFEEIGDADAIVLSGGAPSVATDASLMGNNGEYLDKARFPILGICAGMQFLSEHFGGELGPGEIPEFGKVELKVLAHEDLFRDLPSEFNVWASHNDEVKVMPKGFEITAFSTSCKVEAVRSTTRPIYGVQFHPEVEHTENGPKIFRNFLDIVSEYWHK
ncbi:GMP synthase [glutamine-hydrolyzing] subunit A [Candidatus Methanoplasma termitum]|uniref:GMP synthase [glutamine-hydrolyzing] subunit A n=1 Tax=Candidatus Methanoplasma termitum TaxID=1577791 RepID=A0A0A7LDK3_9ARCH|nr:GMP synthase subunit A [Candidatus Methanoplasma termitum]AIZ57068.1 GMP synthase [glutamine-hydrolyzing] subunit A [Candidatus Methanoplasma termitum]MCL2333499.1 GMP synthase subunit A [Candidatus Methanoplasma sp.]